MPGRQQIEFVIKPDGTVEEKVTGVSGPDCEQVTRGVEEALGDIKSREHTPDYYTSSQNESDTVVTSN